MIENSNDKWEAEEDVRTLIHAGEIEGDKKRVKRARTEMARQAAATEKAAARLKLEKRVKGKMDKMHGNPRKGK